MKLHARDILYFVVWHISCACLKCDHSHTILLVRVRAMFTVKKTRGVHVNNELVQTVHVRTCTLSEAAMETSSSSSSFFFTFSPTAKKAPTASKRELLVTC